MAFWEEIRGGGGNTLMKESTIDSYSHLILYEMISCIILHIILFLYFKM